MVHWFRIHGYFVHQMIAVVDLGQRVPVSCGVMPSVMVHACVQTTRTLACFIKMF